TRHASRGVPSSPSCASGSSSSASSFPAGPSNSRDSIRLGTGSVRPEVDELQFDAEIAAFQKRYRLLERVAVLAADAHQIAIYGGLHFELAVFDCPGDVLRLLGGNTRRECDFLLDRRPGGRLNHSMRQVLDRHSPLDEL